MFAERGYEFHVLSNDFQQVDFPIRFIKHEKAFSVKGYVDAIREIHPDVCINFLHLKDKLIQVSQVPNLPVLIDRFQRND